MELSVLSLLVAGCILIKEGTSISKTTKTILKNSTKSSNITTTSSHGEQSKHNSTKPNLCEIDIDRVGPLPIHIFLDPLLRITLNKNQATLQIHGSYRDSYTRDNATNEVKYKLEVPEITLKAKFNIKDGYINATPFSNETFPFGNISGTISGGFTLKGLKVLGALNISNETNSAKVSSLSINIIRFGDFNIDLGPNVTFGGHVVNWDKMHTNFTDNFENDFSNHKDKVESLVIRGLNKIIGKYTLPELEQLYKDGCPFSTIFATMIAPAPPVESMKEYEMPVKKGYKKNKDMLSQQEPSDKKIKEVESKLEQSSSHALIKKSTKNAELGAVPHEQA